MGSEHMKKSGDEAPFKGVPSDQVGRGSGQDPPDARGEGEKDCEVIQTLREESKAQGEASTQGTAPRGTINSDSLGGGGGSGGGGGGEGGIGSVQRPPSDS
jgi:hypothetical protein